MDRHGRLRPGHGGRAGRTAVRIIPAMVVAALCAATLGAGTAHAADPPSTVCNIGDSRIGESSGLAVSVKHPGVLYTQNDSGNTPDIFAVDAATCQTRAVLRVAGATNTDWEAIAMGKDEQGRPALYVGDIGDNLSSRGDLKIYRFVEPDTLADGNVTPTVYSVAYADGKHDAETMMIDPRDNRVYIASKILFGTGSSSVYQGPAALSTSGTNTFTRVGASALTGTDGAFAPDGRSFTVRDYNNAYVYTAPGTLLTQFALPSVSQGESLTYTADGKALLVGSEGANSPLWKVPLPPEAIPPGGGGAPTVANPGAQTSPVGQPVSLQLQVTGSPAPTCTASGLPAGLSVSPGCLVSGTPTTAGTSTVMVTATNSAGSASSSFTWTIGQGGPGGGQVSVVNPGNQSSRFNQKVSLKISATPSQSGATLTYAASGLPFGLSLNSSTGQITGTAWGVGTAQVTVTVTDSAGKSGTASFTWAVTWF
ncbi:putative Ig domain-containing protein [Yinghuangia seranimata]|uniref:putative Ig domain-containing protein n=1 Tax=Yinghuangia seranimata TaxID=408067 RepID=UPI00248CD413|nr:putative Ig domain-containing protein [Yinghuangia seranimata]MDI2127245.1 putative Ig domain-containing protein [Yinghuangia seranimata]MDI2132190.1 putative Ig domain-containing protein [Yinghuangia seranimata]